MTTSIAPELLLLPDELERKQIFYLLKKHSSWTAWNRILSYFQKWADVTEESIRQSDEHGLFSNTEYPPDYTTPPGVIDDLGKTSIYKRNYVNILKGLALFDEGVRRLAQGDKRVFTADAATGLFIRASDEGRVGYFQTAKHKLEDGEIRWEATTPLMKEFFEALDEFSSARIECSFYILEPEEQYRDMRLVARRCFGLWDMVFLPQLPFPKPLPDIPEIFDVVEVKTGEMVPCSGIWEPVDGSVPTGTMNYLHEDTPAPQYEQDFRNKSDPDYGCFCKAFDATWRLLWKDDRYEDGTIPEEEKGYQFQLPCPPEVENGFNNMDPWKYLRRHNLPNPLLDGIQIKDMRCEGGDVCPHDGNWWTPASQPGTGRFKKGDVMPVFPSSKYGATVWYRVKE